MDGFELLKLRRESGISQDELRKQMGLCGANSIVDIEAGRIEVSHECGERIKTAIAEAADIKRQG